MSETKLDPFEVEGQFGETLNAINLAEAVRIGREVAEGVYGDLPSLKLRSNKSLQSIEDVSDDLRTLWSVQAGIYLRQQNPTLTENIGMYLEWGFGEPSVCRAFAAWLDRIKTYMTQEDVELSAAANNGKEGVD
jgi:hypothetical protein